MQTSSDFRQNYKLHAQLIQRLFEIANDKPYSVQNCSEYFSIRGTWSNNPFCKIFMYTTHGNKTSDSDVQTVPFKGMPDIII
jgi:hypothetical protein